MNCCTVCLCVCTVNIVFLWLSVTGTLLYRCFCTLTNERSNEHMPTWGQIWGQRQFLQLITISAALPRTALPPPLFLFSRFLFIWSICVCFSEFVSEFTCWVPADRFWAGGLGPVFSPLSLINHLSPQSVVTWFWFAFVNHSSAQAFSSSHGGCFIISTFTLTDRYSQHFLHRKCLSLFALTLFWAALMCSCRRKMHILIKSDREDIYNVIKDFQLSIISHKWHSLETFSLKK